jgi:co-chaperonin GroES (HSP10)
MTGYRVLVKPDPLEVTTASGIVTVVPDKVKLEKTGIQKGILVSIGPSAWKAHREVDDKGNEHNGKPWAVPGDYVLYARNAGRIILDPFEPEENEQNEYVIMLDEDIIAVIREGCNPTFDNVVQTEARIKEG